MNRPILCQLFGTGPGLMRHLRPQLAILLGAFALAVVISLVASTPAFYRKLSLAAHAMPDTVAAGAMMQLSSWKCRRHQSENVKAQCREPSSSGGPGDVPRVCDLQGERSPLSAAPLTAWAFLSKNEPVRNEYSS